METKEVEKEKNSFDPETHDRVAKLLDEIRAMEESISDPEILIEPIDQNLEIFETPIETEISGEEKTSEIKIISDKKKKFQQEIESNKSSEKKDKSKKKSFIYKIKGIKIYKSKNKRITNNERDKKNFLSRLTKKTADSRATFTLKLDETGNLVGFSIRKSKGKWFNILMKRYKEKSSESDRGIVKIDYILSKTKLVIDKIKRIIPRRNSLRKM